MVRELHQYQKLANKNERPLYHITTDGLITKLRYYIRDNASTKFDVLTDGRWKHVRQTPSNTALVHRPLETDQGYAGPVNKEN